METKQHPWSGPRHKAKILADNISHDIYSATQDKSDVKFWEDIFKKENPFVLELAEYKKLIELREALMDMSADTDKLRTYEDADLIDLRILEMKQIKGLRAAVLASLPLVIYKYLTKDLPPITSY